MLRVTRSNKTTGCQNPQQQSPLELSFYPFFIKSQKKLSCDRNHKKGLIILFLSFNISILSKFPINVRSLLKSEYLLSQPSLMGETSLFKSSITEGGKCFQSCKIVQNIREHLSLERNPSMIYFLNGVKYQYFALWNMIENEALSSFHECCFSFF